MPPPACCAAAAPGFILRAELSSGTKGEQRNFCAERKITFPEPTEKEGKENEIKRWLVPQPDLPNSFFISSLRSPIAIDSKEREREERFSYTPPAMQMKKKRTRAPAGAVPEVAKKLAEPEEVPEEEAEEEEEEEVEHAEDGEADEAEDHGHASAMAEGPPIINDTDGLVSRYEDIVLGSGRSLPWLERLEIITPEPISVASANDDLAREAALYAPHPPPTHTLEINLQILAKIRVAILILQFSQKNSNLSGGADVHPAMARAAVTHKPCSPWTEPSTRSTNRALCGADPTTSLPRCSRPTTTCRRCVGSLSLSLSWDLRRTWRVVVVVVHWTLRGS
jgi:hypothetical protein